jgi:hypothetical protein
VLLVLLSRAGMVRGRREGKPAQGASTRVFHGPACSPPPSLAPPLPHQPSAPAAIKHPPSINPFSIGRSHNWGLPRRRTGKKTKLPQQTRVDWACMMSQPDAKLREECIRVEALLDSLTRPSAAKGDTNGVNNTGPTRAGAIATPPSTDAATPLESDDEQCMPSQIVRRRRRRQTIWTWWNIGREMVEAHHGWVESGRVEAVEDGMPSEDTWCRHTKCGTLHQPMMFVRRDKMTGEVKGAFPRPLHRPIQLLTVPWPWNPCSPPFPIPCAAFTSALWRCGRASPIPVRLGRLGYMTAALNRPGLAISFNLLDEAIRNGTSTRELCVSTG